MTWYEQRRDEKEFRINGSDLHNHRSSISERRESQQAREVVALYLDSKPK